ncbi:hypothetical protein NEMBOFW57_010326 [Staphylotrichum longicolle]|uniref:CHAT domain-containing protein n=1 Tax=Staphylotrichum longicolle TaxID=669026 RepID=A0AAD4HWX1_9PEZI|nr:hypothetical protein NEMBOFW57_010326 [Staphylotrichum longicolle]
MEDQQDDPAVASAISRSRHQALHGDFDGALATLDAALEFQGILDDDKIQVYREAARVLMRRGFPLPAKNCLDQAIAIPIPASRLADAQRSRLPLLVHRAYVSIVGCGDEADEQSILADAQQYVDAQLNVGKTGEIDELRYDESCLEMYDFLTKIAMIGQLLHGRRGSDIERLSAATFGVLMRHLEVQRRYHGIHIIMASFLACTKPDQAIQRLESILAADGIPAVFRGFWSIELAKQLAKVSRVEDMASRLGEADQCFESCSHRWGRLEVQLLRLQHGLMSSPNALAVLVDLMGKHLQANFPYGVLQTALEVLTIAFAKGDFSTYFKVQEVLHNVCTAAGLTKERILREIQLLAVLNAGTNDAGKVLELGRKLYRECVHKRSEGGPSMHDKLGDIAGWLLTTIPNDYDQLRGDTEEIEVGADKLCLVASLSLELSRKNAQNSQWFMTRAERSIARARLLADSLPEDDSLRINANCDDLLVIQLLHDGRKELDDSKEAEAIRVCDGLISRYDVRGPKFTKAIKYQMRANCNLQRFQKETDLQRFQKERDLQKEVSYLRLVEQDILQAETIFESIRSCQQIMIARHSRSRLYMMARKLFQGLVSDEGILAILNGLESACDMLRRELSALGSLEALRQKQKFVAVSQVCDLYQWAIGFSFECQKAEATWWWSQKRKARSLSDVLGIGVMVPAAIRKKIADDKTASELYERLASLQTALGTADETDKVYIRQNLEEVEDEMRRHPAFEEFVLLRDGAIRGIGDLKSLAEAPEAILTGGRGIFFVDWVIHNDLIFVLTADCSRPVESCRLSVLPFGRSYIDEWIRNHWQTADGRRECLRRDNIRDPSKPLRRLDPLIAPVVDATKPGDMLILSPSGVLSALPLHALNVNNGSGNGNGNGNMHLIERNPVVYAPSASISQICLARSKEITQRDTQPLVFFGILDDAEREARMVYEQMEQLATQDANGRAFCGNRATKETFVEATRGAKLVHYHGHCRFAVDNPLKQCLVLASEASSSPAGMPPQAPSDGGCGGTPSLASSTSGEGQSDGVGITPLGVSRGLGGPAQISPQLEDLLTPSSISEPGSGREVLLSLQEENTPGDNLLMVPEVFNLGLTAPLVVLVGCDSASQAVSTGDEYLGLISGLLCAGATSVIGASWPIPSAAGRAFSDALYEHLKPSAGSADGLVDLAVALQEAALSIMDDSDTSAPYYWAGFCLYGSWVFRK